MADTFFTRAPSTIVTMAINGQTEFTIPFEFLARKFVVVTLLGVDRKVLTMNTDYRFIAVNKIRLEQPAPAGYPSIELRRVTSTTDRLVTFIDGSILRATDLNLAQVQTMHVAEEARDLTADTIGVNDEGHLDARNRKIVNLANATDPLDAVNLGQLRQFDGSTANNADKAQASAAAAKVSETNAKNSENRSVVAEAKAVSSAGTAMTAASDANNSKLAAKQSADAADVSEANALSYSQTAKNEADRATAQADRAEHEADNLANLNDFAESLQSVDSTTVAFNRGLKASSFVAYAQEAGSPWSSVLRVGKGQAGFTIDSEGSACFILGDYTSPAKWKIKYDGTEFVSYSPLNRDTGSRLVEGDLSSKGVVRANYDSPHYAELTAVGDRARLSRKAADNATHWEFDSSGNLWLPVTGANINADGNITSATYHGGSLYAELNGDKQWKSFNPERAHGWTGIGTGYLIAVIDGAEWAFRFEASDARLKTAIRDTETTAVDVIDEMRFRDFSWGNEATFHTGDVTCGLIAQELLKIDPQFVTGCEDPSKGYYQLNVSNLLTLALKAIQELNDKVNTLQKQVDVLTKS